MAKKIANANVKNVVKAANVVQAGPRGFRFGSTYIQSVINGEGVALMEANRLKLVAFAKELGVAGVTAKTDITEAIKTMKKAAKKYFDQNFEFTA